LGAVAGRKGLDQLRGGVISGWGLEAVRQALKGNGNRQADEGKVRIGNRLDDGLAQLIGCDELKAVEGGDQPIPELIASSVSANGAAGCASRLGAIGGGVQGLGEPPVPLSTRGGVTASKERSWSLAKAP